MKKRIYNILALSLLFIGLGFLIPSTYATDVTENDVATATSIKLAPTSKILNISSGSVYDDNFEVTNDGEAEIKVEVYAAPYSYVYSDTEDLYKLGFNNENNFTQISRWITFKTSSGAYAEKPIYTIAPGETTTIDFRISTPENIPAGGQYAVIFVHGLSNMAPTTSGIRTEASPGIVVYGRSTEGEVTVSSEISEIKINQDFSASAKIKNTGNIDFTATGTLKIEPILFGESYQTPDIASRLSVIPDAELIISDIWENKPNLGVFKATYTVTAGEATETVERTIWLIPIWLITLIIILLTILTIWIIMNIRRRKARRSRLAI